MGRSGASAHPAVLTKQQEEGRQIDPQLPRRPERRFRPHLSTLVAMDMLVVGASLAAAVALRHLPLFEPVWVRLGINILAGPLWTPVLSATLLIQLLAVPMAMAALGQYRSTAGGLPHWSAERVLLGAAAVQLLTIAVLYLLRTPLVPRGIMVLDFAGMLVALAGWRAAWGNRVSRRLKKGIGRRNVLFIGGGRLAEGIAERFIEESDLGRRVLGFVSDEPDRVFRNVPDEIAKRGDVWAPRYVQNLESQWSGRQDTPQVQVLDHEQALTKTVVENVLRQPQHLLTTVGDFTHESIVDALDGLCIEEVFILPDVPETVVRDTVMACRARGVDTNLVPPHFPDLGVTHSPWSMSRYTFMGLYRRPISRLGWLAKRTVDIAGGLFGLLVFSPILIASMIAIKIGDPKGDLVYAGTRIGHKGRHFKILKLATMVKNADDLRDQLKDKNAREGPWYQIETQDDFRITKVGKFLRKYSINELMQFWNVVRGDMSLVGPRPLAPDEVSQFVDYDFRYYRAFDVKPGMTGLWQVYARDDPSFDKRIEMDFRYIEEWSIWLDLKLIVMTPVAVLVKKGQ